MKSNRNVTALVSGATGRFKRTTLCTGLVIAFGGLAIAPGTVMAQDATLQRVEITGSSIKRLVAESALPLTTIKADDFVKQGLTTAQEVLNSISMNQTSVSSSQSVGSGTGGQSTADLRGLGSDKTLVLLNGRRLANHPYNGSSVDLNIIPISALDRIEVLRDGASALYGTDAIGGVINFITKRSVTGLSVTAELVSPEKSGGGEKRVNLSGGFGDLDADGYNFFGVFDTHTQDQLQATQREFSKTGVIPSRGISYTSGTSFPANFYSDLGITGNPYAATGCAPPGSILKASNGTCRQDYTLNIDDIPKTQQDSFLGRASFKINSGTVATAEYLHSKSTNDSMVAPPPMANLGIMLHSTSRYYPGGSAGVPAVAGLTGEDLDISWRPLESGNRTQTDVTTSDRFVAALEGSMGNWDYKTGLAYAETKTNSTFTGGYLVDQMIIDGVGSGVLNPFGAQDAAGAAYLQSAALRGQYVNASMKSNAIDFKASKDLFSLPAGPVGFAIGGEFRSDKANYKVDRALAGQADSSGYADAQDQSGDRTISAVFTEFNVPVVKNLELNLAARYDKYSDVGDTFNPKIGVRYQPTQQVLFRGSYNTGFRAPTLYDMHGPQVTTNTAYSYNDPVLCPGDPGVAVAGTNPNTVCDHQQGIRYGGNTALKPETSDTSSIGIVLEPTKSFTATVDLWQINLKDQINSVPEWTIFGDYAKYSNLYHYSADGKSLLYILSLQDNLGEIHTRGVDISLTWRLPRTSVGNFVATLDGTYVDKYEYQNEKNGPFTQNAGNYADAGPIVRWRHNAAVQWNQGPWSMTLAQKYTSGYTDQNYVDDAYVQDVASHSVWSLSGTYTGFKNTTLTAGVKNLFDQNPPFTNQGDLFQKGYDARYTDPVGRAIYLRGNYKFW